VFVIRVALTVITIVSIVFGILAHENILIHPSMSNSGQQIFGIVTTVITAIAFLPQTYNVLKTRVTKSISLKSTLMFAIGNTLLITSMIIKCVDQDATQLIGSIVLGSVSTLLMYITSAIKYKNIKTKNEK